MDTALLRPPAYRLLIIGYGNPLRGDDALGWRVAEHLASLPAFTDDSFLHIETVHQLTPEMSENIAHAETTLFIDAAAPAAGVPAGTLHFEEIRDHGPFPDKLGHHLTPAQAVAYATAIYGERPRAFIASVTAASFEYGAALTPAVEAAIPQIADWASKLLTLAPSPIG